MTVRSLIALLALLGQVPIAQAEAGSTSSAAAPSSPTSARAGWRHEWSRGAVFYEVFVRSFFDSNGDGKGDLPGLISKLDYLNDGDPKTSTDLGVDGLWLMPIFASPSYHGYDTSDYEHVNPDYGTDEDFAKLCREAHKRGMKVLLDLVLNHTSDRHPWFTSSAASPSSPKRDWYIWRDDDPEWPNPTGSSGPVWHARHGAFFYGVFWSGMPDLNYRNPDVRAEIKRIAKLWLERGADGFRLDAVRFLVEDGSGQQADVAETHAFWREFAAYVRSIRPDATLVGEAWSDTDHIADYYGDSAKVAGGDEIPMNFDFPLAHAILEALRSGTTEDLSAQIADVQRTYPRGAIDAPFLTNHDQIRIATQLEGHPGRLREAASLLLTLPGAPFIYYGEELGMRQPDNQDDEFKRQPMAWDGTPFGGFSPHRPWFKPAPDREALNVTSESKDPTSLLAHYRALIALRHRSEALRIGDLELLPARNGVLAYLRKSAGETVLVLHNLSANPLNAGPFSLPSATALAPQLTDPGVGTPARNARGWSVALSPFTSGVYRLEGSRR